MNLFGSCLNTFLAARGIGSESPAGGLEPRCPRPHVALHLHRPRPTPGWCLAFQAWVDEEKGEAVLSDPPHGAAEGTADGGGSFLGVHQPLKDTVK